MALPKEMPLAIKCPRCGNPISSSADAEGVVVCNTCNARLRPQPSAQAAASPAQIEALVAEVRAVRRMQGEILQFQAQMLALLKSQQTSTPTTSPIATSDADAGDADEPGASETPVLPRVRQRRKTVLVVDDDGETLKAAVAALEEAQIPLRTASNGNAALEALAHDKPDVLVIELGIGEPLQGKDFINHVKATMEWIDIPIVLYTRIFVQSQQEARLVHGADEVVLKGPGSPEALLNRVVYLFQRH
jgi:CheY-like chemotaxis protein/ribosomal protein S27E